jgi:hypothetical protein
LFSPLWLTGMKIFSPLSSWISIWWCGDRLAWTQYLLSQAEQDSFFLIWKCWASFRPAVITLTKSFIKALSEFFYRKYIVGIYIVPIYYKQHFPFFWLLLNKIDQQYTELQGKCCNRDKHKTFAKSRGKETLYLQNQFLIS